MIEGITAEHPEEIKDFEKIRQEAIEVLTEFEDEAYFIDEGGAGKVYKLPGGLCMKVLLERHEMPNSEIYDLGNTVAEETKLQEQMARTEFDGPVRVPKTFAYLSGTYPIERSAIIMEELDAVNLQHILNGKEELPEDFDLNSFFKQVENFVAHMHKVEQIAHMDLYARNIMVDKKTGQPYIIDFGRSEKLENDETNAAKEKDDWDRLDEIYEELKSLQNK